MRNFVFRDLPQEIQDTITEFQFLEIDDAGHAEFKVLTIPNPELGNVHVPLALHLVRLGAKKGETVKIIGIE
jgi:hypothetical protein